MGETLTAETSGIADDDGLSNVTFTYQWSAGGADIQGATGAGYALTEEEDGLSVQIWVSFTDDAGHVETLTSAPTDAVASRPSEPLTAGLENTPEAHNGTDAFTSIFGSARAGTRLQLQDLRDHAFMAAGGAVTKAERLEKPSNALWRITVEPDSNTDVTVVLSPTSECTAEGAVCTEDGKMLSNRLELTVSGPEEQEEPRPTLPQRGLPPSAGQPRWARR